MRSLAEPTKTHHRRGPTLGASLLAAVVAMLLWAVPSALAAETIFWNNYREDTIAFAGLDGSGGGLLNTTGGGALIDNPEGMAIDSATGRLFWSSSSGGTEDKGGIFYANLNNSGGAGVLNTVGAPVDEPYGVTIDPVTRTIYWANDSGGTGNNGFIAFAKLDGSGGGVLDTSGATLESPGPVALDLANNRIYWANYGNETISFASLSGGSGGLVDTSGATPPLTITGLAIDQASGRLYWVNNDGGTISYANLSGSGSGDVPIGTATFDDPYGLAFDPATGRIYWANYGHETDEREGAFGFAVFGGGAGDLNIASAPVNGPQNPVIFRGPSGAGAPLIARSATSRALLSCSQGSWAADAPGGYTYQAPQTYGYQWNLNGVPIAGATASSYSATAAGGYTCTVTAANANGTAAQVSAPVQLRAAKFKLALKSGKASTKAGGKAAFKVVATNTGDLASGAGAKLCTKTPKKAGKEVKAAKCASLGKIAGGAKRTVRLKVRAGQSAEGSYKLTLRVRGAKSTKAVKATLVVKVPKG
ncbi:MAG TPA: hypothetical protein VHQ43_00170 [Solirubrobacterales bacterium]|nr:hypothetical protein [Solirubrobacterales bacterium]